MSKLSRVITGLCAFSALTFGGYYLTGQINSYRDTFEVSNRFDVQLNDRQQQIRFIGSDMERSADHMQMAKSPEQIAQLAFGDINFSICRVSFDKEQEMVEGVKNMAFYDKPIQSMKDIRKVNPTIEFWGTLKSDYDGYGDDSNLPDWICSYPSDAEPNFFHADKYAKFLADYLELMQSEGVGLSYIAVSKEWSTYITPAITVEIVKHLKQECKERGIVEPKITDPAAWSIKQGIAFVDGIKELGALSEFYCLTTHKYDKKDTSTYKDFVDAVKAAGGDCFPFQDETGSGAGSRMTEENPNLELPTIHQIMGNYSTKAALYRDGMEGELVFEPFSRGVYPERRSIHFDVGQEPRFMRAYYCLKEFVNSVAPKNTKPNLMYEGGVNPESKYYVPTTTCCELEDVEIMSFANDSEVAVCLINRSSSTLEAAAVTLDGVKRAKHASGRMFNKDLPIEGEELPKISVGGNTAMLGDIPAESVVFFTVKL